MSPGEGSYVRVTECVACSPQTKLRQEVASRNGALHAKAEKEPQMPVGSRPPDELNNGMRQLTTPLSRAADARRLSPGFWFGWIVMGMAVGGALLFTIAGAPAVIEESVSSIVLALAPVVLILGIAWLIGKWLLRGNFGAQAGWLAASYMLTMFAVFLGLAAVGVALLLIPLGLRGRIQHVTRWTIACGVGGVLASIAVLFAPTFVLIEFAGYVVLGVLSFALMALITGVALRSML